ncbi:hypothetical protein IE077_000197 [Cardiosporidium cionae]|uniref:Uncharacterized protein n=1 Tax=Cardiosporidium cionae TaxID=476202 RepID=A0ABQ7JCL9_9APIC|nr:hypothetical protein IE077_000197 [Cardiosporidium cionae]|eukprot:KAF8821752.1 hypothetical protein IE077_000197 [Cardiosporidium cionae]
MVQWDFTRPYNSYGLQVIFALFQRMAPIIPFQPIHALISTRNPHSLAMSALECISVWLQDSVALSYLAQIPLYPSVLQTLLVFAIHNEKPPTEREGISTTLPPSSLVEYAQSFDGLQTQNFAANIRALGLLANLLPRSHMVEDSGISTSSTETGMPEWKSLWLPTAQAIALICAFAPKIVRMKALSFLQAMFLGKMGTDSTNAAFPVIEDPVLWKDGLAQVLFPLLTYNFNYPYPATAGLVNLSVKSLSEAVSESGNQNDKNPYFLSTGDDVCCTSEIWMADALSRRYTLEGANSLLGVEEVYLRKSDSASFVCRILLSRLHLLIWNGSTGLNGVESASSQSGSCVVTPSGSKRNPASLQADSFVAEENEMGSLGYLLPVFSDILSILVSEAKLSPILLRDQYLENLKNIILVVATTPSVEHLPCQNFTIIDKDLVEGAKLTEEASQTKCGRLLVVSIVKRLVAPLFPDTFYELSSILLSSLFVINTDKDIPSEEGHSETRVEASPFHADSPSDSAADFVLPIADVKEGIIDVQKGS